jgi:hypothetical protein
MNNLIKDGRSLFYKNNKNGHYYHNGSKVLVLHFQGKSKEKVKQIYENFLNKYAYLYFPLDRK